MRQLLAIALLVSACGGTVQPGAPTAAPSPSPNVVLSTPSPSARAALDSGYLSGVDAGMLIAESEARGLSCRESLGWLLRERTHKTSVVLRRRCCRRQRPDRSAQGPASNRIEMATAEVLTYGTVKVKTITDFFGAMSNLFGGADGVQARTWVLAALPDAQRDGYAETDIGANHYRLTFEDTGNSSATYLLVAPSAPTSVANAGTPAERISGLRTSVSCRAFQVVGQRSSTRAEVY